MSELSHRTHEVIEEAEFPRVFVELTNALEYANEEKFSTANLIRRQRHYTTAALDPSLNDRQLEEVQTILRQLDFELAMRRAES